MRSTLNDLFSGCIRDFSTSPRLSCLPRWPSQVVLGVNQLFWTQAVEGALRDSGAVDDVLAKLNTQVRALGVATCGVPHAGRCATVAARVHCLALRTWRFVCMQLESTVTFVRQEMDALQRQTVSSLIVVEVHNRDIVTELSHSGVASVEAFEWIAHLRYYWHVRGAC
jgi:dynein heavy chain